jgi:23S rRNA-intervening sequence protein
MRNYKDLRVWEEAHRLTLTVYKTTQAFPKEERFGLTSQIRRASASIAANLAEGCGRRSDGEMAGSSRFRWDQAQSFLIIYFWPRILVS